MTNPPTVFDDDYKGERFTYGLQYRPFDLGSIPRGFIIGTLDQDNNERPHQFGTIQYPFELTDQQVKSFELVRLENK